MLAHDAWRLRVAAGVFGGKGHQLTARKDFPSAPIGAAMRSPLTLDATVIPFDMAASVPGAAHRANLLIERA